MYTEQRKPIVITPQEQQKLLNVVSHYRNSSLDWQVRAFLWKSGCIALAVLCLILWFNSTRAHSRDLRLADQICAASFRK